MAITKINTPEIFDLGATNSSLRLPSGSTASRPSNPNTGEWRYNTDDNRVEYWDGSAWFQIDDEAAASTCTTNTINYPTAVSAYYKMEDATDQTGNYNGTPTNVNFNVAGKFGNAGEFNGTSSEIDLGNSAAFSSATTGELSISLWINTTDTDGGYILAKGDDVAVKYEHNLYLNTNGTLRAAIYNSSAGLAAQVTTTATVKDGNWHHVVLVIDNGTSMSIYVDNGTPVTSTGWSGTVTYQSTVPFLLGAFEGIPASSSKLNGKLDQVRIFPSALTAAQVTELYNEVQCAPTIVPSEHFNVNTYVGNGSTQTIDAKFNEAAVFNGSSSRINTNDNKVFVANEMSISLWVSLSSTGAYKNLITNWNSSGTRETSFLFQITSANQLELIVYASNNSTDYKQYTSSSALTGLTNWNNFSFTLTGGITAKLYVNGSEVTTTVTNGATYAGGTINTTGTFDTIIGAVGNAGTAMDGKIDQVRIFNTTLTASQVTDLYINETTTTAQLLDFPVGAGCIAAYELDGDASDVGGTYGGIPTDIGYTGLQFQPDLVWVKNRDTAVSHCLFDSIRGAGTANQLYSDSPSKQGADTTLTNFVSFNTNGFTLGATSGFNVPNYNGNDYVAWCWKGANTTTNVPASGNQVAAEIRANTDAGFSIVKYTFSSPSPSQTVPHGLNSAPEMIITKCTSDTGNWYTYHKDVGTGKYLILNGTGSQVTYANGFATVDATAWQEYFRSDAQANVAYCFHSVEGFSKIGSYIGTGVSGQTIVTGFETAFVMIKCIDFPSATDWVMFDNKRNPYGSVGGYLYANSSAQEGTASSLSINFLSNGFQCNGLDGTYNAVGKNYIFIAIAADPAPEPVLANSFEPVIYTGTGTTGGNTLNVSGFSFNPDFIWVKNRTVAVNHYLYDSIRGTGAAKALHSNTTSSEATGSAYADNGGVANFIENGFVAYRGTDNIYQGTNLNGNNYVAWGWKAAGIPAINQDGTIDSIVNANPAAGFSIVSTQSNGSGYLNFGHGLSQAPELVITKFTSQAGEWYTYTSAISNGFDVALKLNGTDAAITAYGTNKWSATSTVVSIGNPQWYFTANVPFICYCFNSVDGYQKIGSYTGTGNNVVVTTGFQPRFVMLKRYNSTGGNWWVIDTVRGVANDLLADLPATEASSNIITVQSTGFTIVFSGGQVNTAGSEVLYLAIG